MRERGLAALDAPRARRATRSPRQPPESLIDALAALDATFVELTGREPSRNPGRAYGARTLSYVDCMRDLDVAIGPALVADIAPALQALFEASRWYCGQVNAIGRAIVERALPESGSGPFLPVMIEVVRTLMALPPEIGAVVAELERRLGAVLADPDPATIGARAAAAFADRLPAWPMSVFESVDIQIAARSEDAIAAGDYLVVIGDVHPGRQSAGPGRLRPSPPAAGGVPAHVRRLHRRWRPAPAAALGPRDGSRRDAASR